ncbi:hypothetical protein H6P81_015245 [Aristolochia fimbriata]|uniref:Uncharacterized protein n=1 Tax=Aristolochia fimbriata TaxID=158543 RepID=A0AAV7E716_ARIFI|nr:hypothetical protein H6P81_015245 [Aristolochia fimbriata]
MNNGERILARYEGGMRKVRAVQRAPVGRRESGGMWESRNIRGCRFHVGRASDVEVPFPISTGKGLESLGRRPDKKRRKILYESAILQRRKV